VTSLDLYPLNKISFVSAKDRSRVIKRPLTAAETAASLSRVLSWKLPRYKNFDIIGPNPQVENIKENDFCEKPASFEDKVRDVVAQCTVTNDPSGDNGLR
jgi:hypothetical protein